MTTLTKLLNLKKFLIITPIPVKENLDYCIEIANQAFKIGCDIVEFRLDYLPKNTDVVKVVQYLINNFTKPMLLTLRDVNEGGVNKFNDLNKLKIINTIKEIENVFIDLEYNFVQKYQLKDFTNISGVVISHHFINEKPRIEQLIQEYEYVKKLKNVSIYKVASIVNDFSDLNILIEFVFKVDHKLPITVLPMSENSIYRLIFPLLKSKVMYCPVTESTALGQINLKKCVEFRNLIESIQDGKLCSFNQKSSSK